MSAVAEDVGALLSPDLRDSFINATAAWGAILVADGGQGVSNQTFLLEGQFNGIQQTPGLPVTADLIAVWSNAAGVIVSRNGRTVIPTSAWVGMGEGLIAFTTSAQMFLSPIRARVDQGSSIWVYFPSAVNVMLLFEKVSS